MGGPGARAEFSRLLPVRRIGERELVEQIEAGPEERAALARRFGLLALDRLAARLRVARCGRALVRVEGRLSAEVTQACVVSLDPVPAHIEESFVLTYTLEPAGAAAGEVVIEPEEEEEPAEPVGPGGIDLGEAVAQQLALALDPYPRAEGARLAEAAPAEAEKESPFAVLKTLKEVP